MWINSLSNDVPYVHHRFLGPHKKFYLFHFLAEGATVRRLTLTKLLKNCILSKIADLYLTIN